MAKSHRSSDEGNDDDSAYEFEAHEEELEGEEDEHARADRARFSSQTAYCPECGAEIYDSADVCTKCFTWIDGATTGRRTARRARSRVRRAVTWILIAALLAGAGAFWLVRLVL